MWEVKHVWDSDGYETLLVNSPLKNSSYNKTILIPALLKLQVEFCRYVYIHVADTL